MKGFERVQKRRLYEQITEQLLEMISEGTVTTGDQLPSERDLAESFGVSRTVVREALAVLQEYGVVEIRPGSGVYVREGSEKLVENLGTMRLVSRTEILALLEVRILVESGAAALAAERATPADIREIELAYADMENQVKAGELAAEEDFRFHAALARATHNPILLRVLNTISDMTRKGLFRSRADSLQVPGKPLVVLDEHHRILEAVRKHKPNLARQALINHLENVRVRFRDEGEKRDA